MTDKMTRVAFVMIGHSEYDDDVYRWLSNNSLQVGRMLYGQNFNIEPHGYLIANGLDYAEILPWFIICGCEVGGVYGDHETDETHYYINYDGTIADLMYRFDAELADMEKHYD